MAFAPPTQRGAGITPLIEALLPGALLRRGSPRRAAGSPSCDRLIVFSVTVAVFWGEVDGKQQQLAIQVATPSLV